MYSRIQIEFKTQQFSVPTYKNSTASFINSKYSLLNGLINSITEGKAVFIKFLFIFSISFMTSPSFAITDDVLVKKCLFKGIEKIRDQAYTWDCAVDSSKIVAIEIDNRWYNPSKYIWYQVLTPCNGYDRLIKMVQYYKGQCL